MMMAKVKKLQVVRNKVTGKDMQVTDVSAGPNKEVTLIPIKEYDPDLNPVLADEDEAVKITNEASMICFRLIKDVEPEVPQGYSVDENGKLLKDGAPATEQGQLVVNKILKAYKGSLVLEVAAKSGKGVEIYTYIPERDSFRKLSTTVFPNLKNEWESEEEGNERMIFSFTETGKVTVKEGENEKEIDTLIRSGYIVLNGPMVEDIVDDLDFIPDFMYFLGNNLIAGFLKKAKEDDEGNNVILDVPMTYRVLDGKEFPEIAVLEGERNIDIIDSAFGLVFRSDMRLIVGDYNITTDKMKDFTFLKHLVDVTRDREAYEVRFTFCDDDYNVKTLISKSTKDRGYIYKIA